MISKFFKRRRQKLINDIADAVYKELSASNGWEKFLPPVAIRDKLYMVTENGSIYAMNCDGMDGYEQIIQLRRR